MESIDTLLLLIADQCDDALSNGENTWMSLWCRWIWVTSLVVVFITTSAGQMVVTVVDQESRPLGYVDAYSNDLSFVATTDEGGSVIIPKRLASDTEIFFRLVGYQSVSRSVSDLRSDPNVVLATGLILNEVTLVGRMDNKSRDLSSQVQSINAKVFTLTNPQTPADALSQHADVYVQKSQMGGGSPVIRGFEANKVLLVLDGVRMNNAIYRSGHLHNAVTIDNAMLERLEVIYGPGSLMYGSDAIGGVVHFRSKNPRLNLDDTKSYDVSGGAYLRTSTANDEKSGHLNLNIGAEKWGTLTSFSYSDYGDLVTGSRRGTDYPDFGKRLIYADQSDGQDIIIDNPNPNLQVGTGYSQVDVLQKVLYRPSDQLRFISNFQYSTSSNIPRYDALSERDGQGLRFAEWYYGPQRRILASTRMDLTKDLTMTDKMIVIAAYQRIDEDRIDRRFGSTNLDRQEEDVDVWSLTVDLHKYLDQEKSLEINYGFEYSKNFVNSTAFRTDIESGAVRTDILTRYPSGGGDTDNAAAYILGKKSFTAVDLFAGARYSRYGIGVSYLRSDSLPWPETFYDGVSTVNDALSWSLGVSTKPFSGLVFGGQLSSAFRAPNIDDLAKIRVNSDEISVPNLGLRPEQSLNAEMTISKSLANHTQISATGFYTDLSDAIVRRAYTFVNGVDFLVDEGDTLSTIANVNAQSARVTGVSINLRSTINSRWTVEGSCNYVKGIAIDELERQSPLSHIPPIYGRWALSYLRGGHQIRLLSQYNGSKPVSLYGGSEDNLENATPDGTPAWMVHSIYYQRQLSAKVALSAAVENVLNTHYRPFASGVSAPGRNLIISLQASF